jgi:hypothetical protein
MARWERALSKTVEGAALKIITDVTHRAWSKQNHTYLAILLRQHQQQLPSRSKGTKIIIDWASIGTAMSRDPLDCRVENYWLVEANNPFTLSDDATIMRQMTDYAAEIQAMWCALGEKFKCSGDSVRERWAAGRVISATETHNSR